MLPDAEVLADAVALADADVPAEVLGVTVGVTVGFADSLGVGVAVGGVVGVDEAHGSLGVDVGVPLPLGGALGVPVAGGVVDGGGVVGQVGLPDGLVEGEPLGAGPMLPLTETVGNGLPLGVLDRFGVGDVLGVGAVTPEPRELSGTSWTPLRKYSYQDSTVLRYAVEWL